MRSVKRKFDIQLLNETILKNKAILLGEYPILNRDSNIFFICNCGIKNVKNFRTITNYGGAFCIECTEKNKREKTEETNLKRYGSKHLFNVEEVREKIKQTCIKNYNVENPSQSQIIKEKKIETCIKNHGVTNPTKSEIIREKVKETNLRVRSVEYAAQSPEVKEKIKQTNIEIYGVEHCMQNTEIKEKAKQTNIKIYGFANALQNETIKQKFKETNLRKRGVEYPTQCPEVREKVKETNLKNRGVEYPTQCPHVQKKIQDSLYTFKEYVCPSGTVRRIQGYENLALDELFKTFTEEQIITDRDLIPTIDYEYEDENHVYFPDIFIPHLNKIIEVKSTWTYNLEVDKLKQTEYYTKLKGYDYEYWIFDKGCLTVKTEHE
jgi:hypothetical protein